MAAFQSASTCSGYFYFSDGCPPPFCRNLGSYYDADSAEEPPLFMRKTPSPKKVSNECGNVQPRANSARLRGVTITDCENREYRLTRGFFSTIDAVGTSESLKGIYGEATACVRRGSGETPMSLPDCHSWFYACNCGLSGASKYRTPHSTVQPETSSSTPPAKAVTWLTDQPFSFQLFSLSACQLFIVSAFCF